MASHYWIKLYHEILDDPKMGRLRDTLWRRVVECFLMAGEVQAGGHLPPLEDMAWRLRSNPEILESELSELADVGILEKRNGGWFVTNFAERQSAMSASERAKRWRERQRKQDYYAEETDEEPSPNENRTNRSQNKNRKEKDIDVDEDARTYSGISEHVDVGSPNGHRDPDRVAMETEMLSAITAVVQETFIEHETSERFYRTRDAFIEADITPKQVRDFEEWWRENGHYGGQPHLTSLQNNMKASLPDATLYDDTDDFKIFNPPEEAQSG